MRLLFTLFFIWLVSLLTPTFAQKLHYELPENASRMFTEENYQKAKELYRSLYKGDLKNSKYKYRFGVSMIHSYEWKDGIAMLEKLEKEASPPKAIYYHLAKGYHLTNQYDLALKMYKKYIKIAGANEELVTKANRNITACLNAKELMKKPLSVSFENLGKRVNSKGKDYLPVITPAENILFYTTRRHGTTGRIYDIEGYYTADIFMTKYKYGKWSRTRSIGYPNSYGNEQIAGKSESGQYMLYHVNNPKSKNNLQISKKVKSSYRKSTKIKSDKINATSSEQLSATIANDASYMIFSSNNSTGLGGHDLYLCKKLPNGKWAEPVNMGATINTTYDELYPSLEDEGKTLYFSSKGHNTMGGFDLFKSEYNSSKDEWSKPVNIGYPLNTADDDFNISFTKNKKYAYLSSCRDDSFGDLDIYRVNFKETEPSYSVLKGYLLDADSNLFNVKLTMKVFDKKSEKLYGTYKNTEKGSYIMILPPNEYEINIDVPGKGMFKENLLVQGRNHYKEEIKKDIKVTFVDHQPPPNKK